MAEKNQYDFVDSLRGWAILAVIVCHVNVWTAPSNAVLRDVFSQGTLGVQLFFIVSAFTLFLSLHTRYAEEKNPIRNFFIRRVFRIVPLFYVATLVYFLLYRFSIRPLMLDAPNSFDIIASIFFVNGWYPSSINSAVSGGWSVAVEMNFYLLLPLLFVWITDLEKAVFATFVAALLGMVLNGPAFNFFTLMAPGYQVNRFLFFWLPAQLGVFCLGILFYFIFKRIPAGETKKRLKSYIYMIAAIIWLILVNISEKNFLPTHFLSSIGLLIFVYALALYPIPFFVNRVTIHIGKWSYGIYFVHSLVLDFFHTNFPNLKFFSSATANFFVMFFVVLIVSALISAVTYHFIEKPGIRFGKKLITRLETMIVNAKTGSQYG